MTWAYNAYPNGCGLEDKDHRWNIVGEAGSFYVSLIDGKTIKQSNWIKGRVDLWKQAHDLHTRRKRRKFHELLTTLYREHLK